MTPNQLWVEVDAVLAKYDLLQHPFYQAWSNGELTAEQLHSYGQQYLPHVGAFPAYLTALHSRLPEGAIRKAILANAADEEIDGRSHADLWRQFVAGMEGNAPAAEGSEILPEVGNLVATYHRLAREATLASALGALYAYESQVPRVADSKLAGLKKHYGADDSTCAYFKLHITADVHHSNVWRQLIDTCVEQDASNASDVLDGVTAGASALWQALDGIEASRMAALAN
jgi:pyrroloquinoline-quinone synthase